MEIVVEILQKKIGELEVDKAFAMSKIIELRKELEEIREMISNEKEQTKKVEE